MAILEKAIHMFNEMPIKIPRTFFTEIEKSFLELIWKHKGPQITQELLSKISSDRGIIISDIKLYNRVITRNIIQDTIETLAYSCLFPHCSQ
jgi:hypothetical protein